MYKYKDLDKIQIYFKKIKIEMFAFDADMQT